MQITLRKFSFKSFALSTLVLLLGFSVSAQDDKTAASLYNEGLALLKAKDYAAGLPLLEQALEKATAEENEKVIELSKKNGAIAAYNVANAKAKEGDLDGAKALYMKGIDMNPTYGSNYSGLGNVLNKQGKNTEAIDQYLKAVDIATTNEKPKRVAKYFKKMNVIIGKLYAKKNHDEVISLGKKILAVKSISTINYYVSRSSLEKGDHQAALDYAKAAIADAGTEGVPVEDKYYVAQAKAYVALGNKAEAIKSYEMVTGDKYKEQAQYQIQQLKG